MGDIKTHAQIAEDVMAVLRRERPDENYMFFELGNWLTDVSQFRDPPSMISAKITIWNIARQEHAGWQLGLVDLHGYLDALMGQPGRNGGMARWAERVWFAVGCEKFRRRGMQPDHFEDVYRRYFTQYWPHEHLDFPPWPRGSAIGDRTRSDAARHQCDAPPQAPAGSGDHGEGGGSAADSCWFRVMVVDEITREPVPGVELRITTPDRAVHDRVTDNRGIIDIRGLPHGVCEVLSPIQDMVLVRTLQISGLESSPRLLEPSSTASAAATDQASQPKFRIADVDEHTVSTGESLASLARSRSMTWQSLAMFNFGTAVPRLVNRALHDVVGCRSMTDDRLNYTFTDADRTRVGAERPGLVYFPGEWSARDLATDNTHTIRVRAAIAGGTRPAPVQASGSSSTDGQEPGEGAGSGPARKILKYLDEQIVYVAELLTVIEQRWSQLAVAPVNDVRRTARRRVLARLGHASHAVEDFYFHSNFVEIAWSRLGWALPQTENDTRSQRIFYRRQRAPASEGGQLSPSRSFPVGSLYTGSFGSEDIFHTLMDALENIAEDLDTLPRELRVPLSILADEGRRRGLRNEAAREQFLLQYREVARRADQWIDLAVQSDRLNPKSGDALREAFRIDNQLFDDYDGVLFRVPVTIRGPFAFFTEMLVQADLAHERSEQRSAELDRPRPLTRDGRTIQPPAVIQDDRSSNGASAENIGCHSLLAKDSPTKKPLREPAINVATRAATFIARLMARQVSGRRVSASRFHREASRSSQHGATNTLDARPAIDWLHLLQHLLCHPDECEHGWRQEVLRDKNASIHYVVRTITDRQTIEGRMRRRMEEALQRKYRDLEEQAEAEWRRLIG